MGISAEPLLAWLVFQMIKINIMPLKTDEHVSFNCSSIFEADIVIYNLRDE